MQSKQKKIFSDNPNPNAKIGFVIFYPFQFYVQKDIYKHLKDEAEFIVDLGVFFPVEQPNDLLVSIVFLLKKHNAHFRILHYDSYFYGKYLEDFFSQYSLLVSLWERGCLQLKCNIAKRKVRLGYGSGKELTFYRPSGRMFDLALAYGERDAAAFSLFSECKIVGIPKFDDWFNNEFDEEFLFGLKDRLDSNKKTILYLPTHSDLGSIKDVAEPLKKLTKDYNVITKLHYLNITDEPELVQKLKHKDLILLKDDADLLHLLKIADVVLSDNSSAIFDAILADKPLVVTDFLSDDYLDVKHKETKRYRRGNIGAVTYSGSIEQKIKKEGLVVSIQKPEQLADGIKQGLEDASFYKSARKKINEQLTAFNDGKCGERAAKAIIDLLKSKELPEKPPLYHALEIFERNLIRRSFLSKRNNIEKISEYEDLLLAKIDEDYRQTIVFSVIVIHDFAKTEFLESTLRSLLEQKFSYKNYEIIIANGPSEEEIKEIIKGIPRINDEIPIVKYVAIGEDNSGVGFIDDAINTATGEIICFIESGYVAPSNWLLNFSLTYKNHPRVGGVGGYSFKYSGTYNIFDEYYYLELGKKLGVNREGNYLEKLYEVKNELFYQNPAGALVNMSYKKETLKGLPINYHRISLIELAEMMMKKEVLREGNILCFIPSRVIDLERMTFKKFVQKNFREGLGFYLFCLWNPNFKKYYLYNIFSIIKLPLTNVFNGYYKMNLSFIIFIGTLFRWLGGVYGFFMIVKNQNK